MTPIQEMIVSTFEGDKATCVNEIANQLCEADWEAADMERLRGVVEITLNELVDANIVHAVSVSPGLFVLTNGLGSAKQGRRRGGAGVF